MVLAPIAGVATGSPSFECFSVDIIFCERTSVTVEIIRDCMGKSLNRRARIFRNKMSLQHNELLYLCLVFNWAASGIILAEFARVVVSSKRKGTTTQANDQNDPRSRPDKHETQIKQFIALKVHFIRENPCSAIE